MTDRLSADFWKFWSGQTISNLGSSFTAFALPLLVYKLTGSALNLAGTMTAYFVPYLLFGLVIGAWVDRLDRKRLMIAVDIGRAAAIASVPALDYAGILSIWWIYGATFVAATLTIAFDACEFAAIPSLVPKESLVAANGRIMATYQAAQVSGPLLAGLLVATIRVSDALLVDAASFLVSASALALIRRSFNAEEPREPTRVREDVAAGLRYVLGHPVLRNISLMMALINFVGSTAFAQLVLFGKVRLHASDAKIGFLFAAGSAGVVVMGLLAGPIRKHLSFGVAALGGLMLDGIATALFGLNHNYYGALVLWAAASGFGLFFNINTQSLRQAIVPPQLLGRVASIAGVLAWGAIPLGTLAGGAVLAATDSPKWVYAGIGGIVFAIALAFRLFSPLGHAEDYLPQADGPPVLEGIGDAVQSGEDLAARRDRQVDLEAREAPGEI